MFFNYTGKIYALEKILVVKGVFEKHIFGLRSPYSRFILFIF